MVFAAALAGASPRVDNDAGSGMDAGDTTTTALVLLAPGQYQGDLNPPGDDVDWYRLPPASADPICAYARARGYLSAEAVLTVLETRTPAVARPILPSGGSTLFLVAPDASGVFLGFESARSSMTGIETGATPGPRGGHYRFDVTSLAYRDLDPSNDGEGADAPDAAPGAPRPGPCFAGRLSGSGDVDVYALDGQAGQTLDLSFALRKDGGAATLSLRAPGGDVLATIGSGEAQSIHLFASGTYLLEVRASSGDGASTQATLLPFGRATMTTDPHGGTSYLVGASYGSDEPPDTTSCRPTCVE